MLKLALTGVGAVAAVAVLLTPATSFAGATVTIGNATTARAYTDTYSNFTIIDTAATAPNGGLLSTFRYYAANTGTFQFVVVDSANTVTWVSNEITAAAIGVNTYTPSVPVPVTTGERVGVYFASTGSIPFDYTATTPDPYTPNNNGLPEVGDSLNIQGSSGRDYSYQADEQACSFAIGAPLAGGDKVFSANRGAIPVKLTGCSVDGLAPTVAVTRTSGDPSETTVAATSVSAADSGSTMRYDATAGQYVYNLAASGLGAGTYQVTVSIAGVPVATETFGLR